MIWGFPYKFLETPEAFRLADMGGTGNIISGNRLAVMAVDECDHCADAIIILAVSPGICFKNGIFRNSQRNKLKPHLNQAYHEPILVMRLFFCAEIQCIQGLYRL